jgi:hypothetical protein
MSGRCEHPSKRGFPTRGQAVTAARKINQVGGPKMRAYKCACGRFHLTSNTERHN